MSVGIITGQEKIIEFLHRSLTQGRLGHAVLFSGPSASVKKALAMWLAKKVNCANEPAPCGSCKSCTLIESGNYADLFQLRPEGKNIKISQVRALKEKLYYLPREKGTKVCIIEEAELLTKEAANSLLKILEEPPEALLFILLTSAPSALPVTVLSRCYHFPLLRLGKKELTALLEAQREDWGLEPRIPVMYSRGIPGMALELALDQSWQARREEVFACVSLLRSGSPLELEETLQELAVRDDLPDIIDLLAALFRDELVWKLTGSREQLLNPDREDFFSNTSFSASKLEEALRVVMETRALLASNTASQLLLEAMVLRLRRLDDNEL